MRSASVSRSAVSLPALGLVAALALGACSTTPPPAAATNPPAVTVNPPSVTAPDGGAILEPDAGSLNPGGMAPLAITEPTTGFSGAYTISDPAATGGQAVILYSTGATARFVVPSSLAAGTYTVRARARGQYYQGWPVIALTRNGTRLATNQVGSSNYVANTFGNYSLKPGDVLDISFTNDLYGGSAATDRNVIVDYLTLDPVSAPAPAPAPSP
ncbi:MAG TPA: carbohydrate-binding domain-containing protein, partial [Deinococcales bacterium]|nr:carbohydrate-binding domain-containing protein [Deinococcales bacterium]